MFSICPLACSSARQARSRATTELSGVIANPRSLLRRRCCAAYSVLALLSRCPSASAPMRIRSCQLRYITSSAPKHLPQTIAGPPERKITVSAATRSYTTAHSRQFINSNSETPITMSLTIRPVTESDKETWLNLWAGYNTFYKRTIPAEVTEITFTRFLDSSTRMYCAVAEDPTTQQVIGFITWYPHISTSSIKEIVYIHDLFVDPTVRNRGTGRKLIEHVYEEARKLPASQVYWTTQYYNYVGQILYTKIADRTDFVKYMKVL